jgi:hypothetical protein
VRPQQWEDLAFFEIDMTGEAFVSIIHSLMKEASFVGRTFTTWDKLMNVSVLSS